MDRKVDGFPVKHGVTICFDFDGVIHCYTSGWKGTGCIPDGPVPGIKELIAKLRANGFQVVVSSARFRGEGGVVAVTQKLVEWGIEVDGLHERKPMASIYIDDRGLRFDGNAENLHEDIYDALNEGTWVEREKASAKEG